MPLYKWNYQYLFLGMLENHLVFWEHIKDYSLLMSSVLPCHTLSLVLLFSHSYRLLLNEFKVIRHKSLFKCLDNTLLQATSDFSHAVPLCPPFLYIYIALFNPAWLILWKCRQRIPPNPLHSHRTTCHHTPEGCHLHGHCCVNLKSHMTEMKCWNKWVDFVRSGKVTRISGRVLRGRSNKQKDICNKWSGHCWKCDITMNASRTFGRKGFIS
jgi:hypothetical protein